MRIEPNEINDTLAGMLRKVGRDALIETGFELDRDTLDRSRAMCRDTDHAIFHALFDRGAPHAAAITPRAAADAIAPAAADVADAIREASEHAGAREQLLRFCVADTTAQLVSLRAERAQAERGARRQRWAQIAVLVAILLTLLCGRAKAQPAAPLIVRGSNGSSILITRSGGLLNFKCDGTTVICSWSASLNTFTITSAASGGATIPSVTNLIKGDGAGNGADSGIAPANVALITGSYSNPAWITGLAAAKITGLATVATTGAYSDLSGKPTVPTIASTSTILAGDGAGNGVATTETGTGNTVRATSPTLTTPAINTSETLSNNGIGAVGTDGYVIQNTTAAAAGAQQWSPRLSFIGQGWKTNSTAASQTVRWDIYNQPIQRAANPDTALNFIPTINGVAQVGPYFCAVVNAGVFIELDTQANTCGVGNGAGTGGNTGVGPVNGNGVFGLFSSSNVVANLSGNGLLMRSSGALMFYSSTTPGANGSGDVTLDRDAAGVLGVQSGAAGTTAANYRDLKGRHLLAAGTAPTITAGFGTSPTIAGSDESITVTIGTGGTATTGTVTFGTAYTTNIPACQANDNTTILLTQASPTLTTVVVSAASAWTAADKISILCRGY